MRTAIASLSLCLLLSATGCARLSAYSQAELAFQQDVEACTRYGAEYGSPVYADCMALQRQRHHIATEGQNALVADGNAVIAGRR